jgi:hypothetical protein
MHLPFYDFLKCIFFRKIGVADLVLDHHARGMFCGSLRFTPLVQCLYEADDHIRDIDENAVEYDLENHVFKVDDLVDHVK